MDRSYLKLWKRYIAEDAYQISRFTENDMYDVYDHEWGDWVPAQFIAYDAELDEFTFRIRGGQNAGQLVTIPDTHSDSDIRGGRVR